MIKYGKSNLWVGEKSELLHGPFHSYKSPDRMPWFTKDKVLFTIKEKWDFSSFNIKVSKILWNSEFAWFRNDNVECERVAFDMYHLKDLDELVGYLFQASIEGYAIRYVSTDTLTGIYLQKTSDFSTNIDDDVLTTLIDVVNAAVEDRKPRCR